MHTLLLGKIGQGITQDSGQEPRAKTFWGRNESNRSMSIKSVAIQISLFLLTSKIDF